MKKYRLKQWYPSLYDDIEVGTIVDYGDGWIYYTNKRGNKTTIEMDEEELSYEDFWELIEEQKPLFTTYDGVQVTDGYMGMILVCRDLSKSFRYAKDCRVDTAEASTKIFAHESNADEYIWKNKPLLSVKDVVDNCVNLSYAENIELIELAKERSKE